MATYNPNYESIGQAFVQHFYTKFDVPDGQVRTLGLHDLYDAEHSFMTFEGNQVKGRQAILDKYGLLPFRTIQHVITKTDSQPLPDGSIFVTVIGQLKTDEDPVNSFNHCFILRPNSTGGSFFISNEVFRLVLH
uniref:NTF2-related export protein n=1 Tax=Globodera pallida TaxID=36090 RepID=A0A183BK08_GLOPA